MYATVHGEIQYTECDIKDALKIKRLRRQLSSREKRRCTFPASLTQNLSLQLSISGASHRRKEGTKFGKTEPKVPKAAEWS